MAVEIGVFRLIREALYFCSTITATTSKFSWELQIDVSIIYWFPMDLFLRWTDVFLGGHQVVIYLLPFENSKMAAILNFEVVAKIVERKW